MMPRPDDIPPAVNDRGDETHPSWVMVGAHRIHGDATLFDSEVVHREFVRVSIQRASRHRELKQDWLFGGDTVVEFDMSLAQWGAFVSSFGTSGVPATLSTLRHNVADGIDVNEYGQVPGAPHEPRLGVSVDETTGAADKAFADIASAVEAVADAFDRKAGRRELGEALHTLQAVTSNATPNVRYAAKKLVEHVENTVEKARADIEGMARQAALDADNRRLGAVEATGALTDGSDR